MRSAACMIVPGIGCSELGAVARHDAAGMAPSVAHKGGGVPVKLKRVILALRRRHRRACASGNVSEGLRSAAASEWTKDDRRDER